MKAEASLITSPAEDFAPFYRREYRQVVGLALVLCGSLELAEDLGQEAFAAAYQQWDRIGSYDKPGTWVRRVVANKAVSVTRRRAAETRALTRLFARRLTVPGDIPAEDAEVWAAVRRLPRRQAQVIALTYLDELSPAEVAEVLGCGEGTVWTHLRRARLTLSKRLANQEIQL
jgi:RNA polymerase sigma-70 factor (ECF subfamily)